MECSQSKTKIKKLLGNQELKELLRLTEFTLGGA